MHIRLRAYSVEDVGVLREMDRALFGECDIYSVAFMESIPSQSQLEAFVALGEANAVVAWALIDRSDPIIRLRSLSVRADHQRKGYGEFILRHLLARSNAVDLLVQEENAAAIACYSKLGFRFAQADPTMPERLRMVWRNSQPKLNETWHNLGQYIVIESTETKRTATEAFCRKFLRCRA